MGWAGCQNLHRIIRGFDPSCDSDPGIRCKVCWILQSRDCQRAGGVSQFGNLTCSLKLAAPYPGHRVHHPRHEFAALSLSFSV